MERTPMATPMDLELERRPDRHGAGRTTRRIARRGARDSTDVMLQHWVAEAARVRPAHRAVLGEDVSMTYAEIDDYSSRLASLLRDQGCRRGDRVAVLMPDSARAVASFMGILKAGCAYVPLDATGRVVQVANILRQVEPKVVLAGGCAPEVIGDLGARGALGRAVVGWLGPDGRPERARFTLQEVAAASAEAPRIETHSDDTACILFKSGMWSRPVGVPITHRNVRVFIEWAVRHFGLGPDDRLAAHSALSCHLSTFDLYASLAAGAELHLIPARARARPHEMMDFIEDRSLTTWFSMPWPLTFAARFGAADGRDLSTLRNVAWCGDTLPTPTLRYWRRRVPHATFTNLYGATETTIASSYYRVPRDFDDSSADIPIGAACPGEELLVMDDRLRIVPDGDDGDIYIRGAGLSPGYWRDPERTREAFVPDPDSEDGAGRLYRTGDRGRRGRDGQIRFLGRKDCQIEGAGDLVPAEVEHAILQLDEVAACAVVPVTSSDFSGSVVGCAYVPSNGRVLRTRDVTSRLADNLPEHMIPSRWLVLEELPVDRRGKIDRALTRTLLGG